MRLLLFLVHLVLAHSADDGGDKRDAPEPLDQRADLRLLLFLGHAAHLTPVHAAYVFGPMNESRYATSVRSAIDIEFGRLYVCAMPSKSHVALKMFRMSRDSFVKK